MRIYFDFELTDDLHGMNAHLVDIMLVFKDELHKMLKPYEKRIDDENVFVFIRIIPDEFGIGYGNISPEFEIELVKNVNMKFDFETPIRKIAGKELN